jgi:hypothetical protein
MSTKNWYQKKRYIIPLLLVILLTIVVMTAPKSSVPTVDKQISKSMDQPKSETKTKFTLNELYTANGQSVKTTALDREVDCKYTPDKSQEFVKVNIEFENKGKKTMSYNNLYWKLMDASGDIKNPAFCSDLENKADKMKSGELAINASKKFFLVFAVPKASSPLTAIYQPNMFTGEQIQFELN